MAALLAGLGVVCTVSGVVFIWDTRKKMAVAGGDTTAAGTPDAGTPDEVSPSV